MKKLPLIILTVCSAISVLGQEIIFTKVIETDSVGKAKIYSKINEWFASNYKSSKDVIQLADKEEGTIIGNGAMIYSYGKAIYDCYNGSVNYTIKVFVKDNRYKVEITNFSHTGKGPSCSLGAITTAEYFATTGVSVKYQNTVWDDIKKKIGPYADILFNALDKETKAIKFDKDDW